MSIAVPVVGTRISVSTFGKPVVDAVNDHETRLTAVTALAPVYTARSVLSSSQPSVTMSGIPFTLKRLRVVWSARADPATQVQLIQFRINGDSTALYSYTYQQTTNTTLSGVSTHATTSAVMGLTTAGTATSGWFGSGEIVFSTWDGSNGGLGGVQSGVSAVWVSGALGSVVASHVLAHGVAFYANGPQLTSITFLPQSGNFIAGTDFQLEGW